jgi:divalent metal cation (Fe/Co/Zn/Cd) transporter
VPPPDHAPPQRRPLGPKGLLRLSIAVALVTIVLKGLAGYITNSMGLIRTPWSPS